MEATLSRDMDAACEATEYHIRRTLETSTRVFAELEKNAIEPAPFPR